MLALAAAATNALILPASPAQRLLLTPRAGAVVMANQDDTRDSAPAYNTAQKQSFDNDMSGWKAPGGGGDAHGGAGFESTDVPDFLPEEGSELAALASGVSFTDGLKGSQSQNDPTRRQNSGPELAGALDSNPDIYTPEKLAVKVDASDYVLPEPEFRLTKMAVSATHEDFEITCASTGDTELTIEVSPVCMTFEDFHCGFTADSHPAFKVKSGMEKGTMERRNGPATPVTIQVDPRGASGELVGHLCFILPEEKDFSTFYTITCKSM